MKMQWFIDLIKDWVIDQAYATMAWVEAKAYATEDWVLRKGYATVAWVIQEINATVDWVIEQEYATMAWVSGQVLALKAWVEAKGYATMAWVLGYCPKARAYLSANQSIPDRTWTRINFNLETYDTHSRFANYKFTAAQAGYYAVTVTVHLTNPGDGKYFYPGNYNNATQLSVKHIHASSTASVGSTVTDIIYLELGDYIEGYCFHSAGADRDILGGSHFTFMTISQIF